MNLQEFEKLLSAHLPLRKVRRIIRIYLDVASEEMDGGFALSHQIPERMTDEECRHMMDSLHT